MENTKMKVELLPHTPFLNKNGTFNLEKAIDYSAKIAGECYEPDGWAKLKEEPCEKTARRAKQTLNMEHHSVYDHVNIGFEISNMPKILAMLLNNEKQYNTSEKSARYTRVVREEGSFITRREEQLYNKWMNIFKMKIKDSYGDIYNDTKIEKLAQENSRYLVTVFMPTQMIHTIPMGQLNKIVAFMQKLLNQKNLTSLQYDLLPYLKDFIECFDELHVLDDRLQTNRKNRSFSLFQEREHDESFGDVYSVNYLGSYAELAQAQRHRTLDYEMKELKEKQFFVPPIIQDDAMLILEWLEDIRSVEDVHPQGELVAINERGTYENFILKSKERLCSAAQLEIMNQTSETLKKYQTALIKQNHPLAHNIEKYSYGTRCTFQDYECTNSCPAKVRCLNRKI